MSKAEVVDTVPDEAEEENPVPQILNDAQRRMMQGRTPEEFIHQRKGRGGKKFDYVEVHYVRNQLNEIFGHNWDEEIVDKTIGDSHIVVHMRLRVRSGGKEVTKDGIGSESITTYSDGPNQGEPVSLGDDVKSAVADGLKKAASKLGIAEDVYWQNKPADGEEEKGGGADYIEPGSRLHKKLEATLNDIARENNWDKQLFRETWKDFLWEWRGKEDEKSMKNLTVAGASWLLDHQEKWMKKYRSWIDENNIDLTGN